MFLDQIFVSLNLDVSKNVQKLVYMLPFKGILVLFDILGMVIFLLHCKCNEVDITQCRGPLCQICKKKSFGLKSKSYVYLHIGKIKSIESD